MDKIVIDSGKEGNILRFVNDLGFHNVEPLILPYENKWNVYYKAKADI